NEKVGHVAGQGLLQDFARALQRSLRITDTCSRYGLNQIMAVLPNTNLAQATQACTKLSNQTDLTEILDTQLQEGICLSVRVGPVSPQKHQNLDDVIDAAASSQVGLRDFCF
ncbi:MAG: diguanylate cyclase, partial [Deltaproteobacteria bacterium]|nr:diguanylate cyclase [Deltaproteobacteria bacterium]